MTVEFKDYYDVLGVPRDASDADIKAAFRRLARRFHPDVARNQVGAEDRFKEINEANEVLSDPDKRRRYDELGANWNRPERPPREGAGGFRARGPQGPEVRFAGTGFSEFFEEFFGSGRRPSGGFGGFGRDWEAGEEVSEAAQRGQDTEGDILVTLQEVLHGSTRTVRLLRSDARTGQASTQTLQVKIPPGVREGQRIRLAGIGQRGVHGGPPGNLYLRVKLARHPDFRVRGGDLFCDLELAPWEAVLGATVAIATLDGPAALKIPAGTTAGRQLRLRGKGLPRGDGTRGCLYAIVSIQVPATLTPEERPLWQQLAAKATFDPRRTP